MKFKRKIILVVGHTCLEKRDIHLSNDHVLYTQNGLLLRTQGDKIEQIFLHVLSDEEVKEGDKCFNSYDNKPWEYRQDSRPFTKIIASNDKSLNLPGLSDEFIRYYCNAHNTGELITYVMVEYDLVDGKNMVSMKFKTSPDCECESFSVERIWVPKINPSNTIEIHKFKDSYTRKEVIDIVKRNTERLTNSWTSDDLDWLEKNL